MVRKPCFDKNGIKRGAWSQDEDDKLRAYVAKYGHSNWRELPKYAGLARCGKSCRLRWMNYLRPEVRRGVYTEEENELILMLHEQHGNRWSLIAKRLSGRTDNEIKNHWHTHLKKRAKEATPSTAENEQQSPPTTPSKDTMEVLKHPLILESSQLLPQPSLSSSSSCECAGSSGANWFAEVIGSSSSSEYYLDATDSFWNEPFLVDTFDYKLDPYPHGYYHYDNHNFLS